MSADWNKFIDNVSTKISSQTIEGSYDPEDNDINDFASYIIDQYIEAIVDKAQTPTGNKHKKPQNASSVNDLKNAFSSAFKKMEKEISPTLEEKENDPMYADADVIVKDIKKIYNIELINEAIKNEPPDIPDDPYYMMSNGIINYWNSCLEQPFTPDPPIPPCNIGVPGIFSSMYYGSRKKLADSLRKSFNVGKKYKKEEDISVAGKAVATAISRSFSEHMLDFKLVYNGSLSLGTSVPSVGFVSFVF
jgi:hypothetical protein